MTPGFNPQPKQGKKKKAKRDLAAFREMILGLDPVCRSCARKSTSAHHIKYRSAGGMETPENGIGLCSVCDHYVHHGMTTSCGDRWSAHKCMLKMLDMMTVTPFYRWHAVHDELRRKVG